VLVHDEKIVLGQCKRKWGQIHHCMQASLPKKIVVMNVVWKGESSVETRIIEAIERAQKVNVENLLKSRKLEETSQIDVDVIYQKKDQIPMETIMMI